MADAIKQMEHHFRNAPCYYYNALNREKTGKIILSDFLSPHTWRRINIRNNAFIPALLMDEKRIEYLCFHHEAVFKGSFEY